jgi:hypothetical protein
MAIGTKVKKPYVKPTLVKTPSKLSPITPQVTIKDQRGWLLGYQMTSAGMIRVPVANFPHPI